MRKVLLAIGLLAGLLGTSHAMTASDIISRARFYLKDQSSSSTRQQFSDATLMTYISDGQREANSYAWLILQRYTFSLTANTTEYSLPNDFIAANRVMFKKASQNAWIKLDQTSFNQLDAESSGWMGLSAGTPYRYYVYLTTTPVVGFVPAPASTSTGTVQMDYVANTLEVTATTQTPFNGFSILVPYHPFLVYYVVCRANQTLEEYDVAQPFCDMWTQSIAVMKAGILKQPDYNPGFSGRRTP